jgi:hypothetical protein
MHASGVMSRCTKPLEPESLFTNSTDLRIKPNDGHRAPKILGAATAKDREREPAEAACRRQ